ncbi:FtsB family cell division protein [Methylocystis sp.]|uniref:FtsB family cell division protein n=1 Tax=Methylocystis sp. TaxID=1911079 RepID=UPI003DA67BFE
MPNRRTPPRGGRPPRNNRPAQRSGTGRARSTKGAAAATPPPKAKFTNRAAVLLVVFALLVISYASSMRAYLHQRAHIRELNAKIAGYNLDIASAEEESERWKSAGFIEQQARARFGWVMPGETAYQVLDGNGKPLTGKDKLADPSTIAQPVVEPEAWWSKIGESVRGADQPPQAPPPTPPPADKLGPDGTPR